ncbi:MAG: M48 family metallopeptidase [Hyphomonadaceae bacterium]|nr:M48 family metallopeptidase [Hyphomonadaceae bacterium]
MIIDKGDKMALVTKTGETVNVRLEVNPKARRLILRLDERKREAVAVAPSKRKIGEAAAFARDRVDWIAEHLQALPQTIHLKEGAQFMLRGEPCKISLDGPGRTPRLEIGPPLVLRVPGLADTTGQRVERYLRKSAKSDLSDAVIRYCDQLGVEARRVTVKDTRSRWGSCTSDGRLAFSWRLVMAPNEVLEYVAAHECAHLLEMNHSPAFWAHVATCRPDWKAERAWLRKYGRDLHAVQTG